MGHKGYRVDTEVLEGTAEQYGGAQHERKLWGAGGMGDGARGCPAGRGERRHEDTVGCSCRTDVWDARGQRGAGAKLGEQHEACSTVGWLQDDEGDMQRKGTGWKGAQQDIRGVQVCVHPAWKCRMGAGHAGVQVGARRMVT